MTNIIPGKKIPEIRTVPLVDQFGNFVLATPGDIKVFASRRTDDKFWDDVSAFITARTAINMIKVDDINHPGVWKFAFPLSAVLGEPDDVYDFEIEDTSSESVNGRQHFTIEIGGLENTLNLLRKGAFNQLFHDPADGKLKLLDDDDLTVIATSDVLNKNGDILQPITFSLVVPVKRTKAILS